MSNTEKQLAWFAAACLTLGLLGAVIARADYYNEQTGARARELPNPLRVDGSVINRPTPARYAAAGWLMAQIVPLDVPEGYVAVGAATIEVIDGVPYERREIITEAEYAQRQLDARAASIDAEVMTKYVSFHSDYVAAITAAVAAGAQIDPESVTYENLIAALSQLEGEQWGRLANALTARWNAVCIVAEHKHGWTVSAVYYEWLPVLEYRRQLEAAQ